MSHPTTSRTALRRLYSRIEEYLSHAVVGGTVVVLTGFAPEHWVAHVLHDIHVPGWLTGFDLRFAAVSLGVAIIVGDILWRHHAPRRKPEGTAGSDKHSVAETVDAAPPEPVLAL